MIPSSFVVFAMVPIKGVLDSTNALGIDFIVLLSQAEINTMYGNYLTDFLSECYAK